MTVGHRSEVAADAEVDGAVVEEIGEVEWDVDEPNPHTGCLIRQSGDQRFAEQVREVVRRGDDEVVVRRGRIEGVGLEEQIDVGADPVDLCPQLLGARRQPHPASDAHEDRVVQRLAEPGQCAADRGLRQVYVVGGAHHAFRVQQRLEDRDEIEILRPQRHGPPPECQRSYIDS